MTRFAKIVVGLSAILLVAGCYNTSSVKNGGMACSAEGKCPDGFTCSAGRCWKNGTQDAICTAPLGPVPSCSEDIPSGSDCDPVCQSGCGCHRCILSSSATQFVCEDSTPSTPFVDPLGDCSASNRARCAPGSVCIADATCSSLCYKTCRSDSDCPIGARCTTTGLTDDAGNELVSGLYLCSAPAEACNPTGAAICPSGKKGFNCVFLAGLNGVANSDVTVCDCATLHNVPVGGACAAVPDNCAPGSACVDGQCHVLCERGSAACPKGICSPIYGSRKYGYCPL